jgi:myo-inositol 2-dehydrogenase / D-chiro-inositol 1-dehydrogenase
MAAPLKGQINVALIGAGFIGQVHSKMLRLIADRTDGSVRVGSVYDRSRQAAQKLAEKWPGAKTAASPREILDDPQIDAVYICTPTATHRELCVAAAGAGKHVFCEKPLAMSSGDAAQMHGAIEKAGVVGQVGLVMRFAAIYTAMRELLNSPAAGKILAVTMRDDQEFPIRGAHPSLWRNDPSLTAGGALAEHSVHDIDMFTWIFGPIARLYCTARFLNGAPGIEDIGLMQLEFAAGFHGQLTSIWHGVSQRASNRRMEVLCENLMLAIDDDVGESIYLHRGNGPAERMEKAEVMRRFEDIILRERPYLLPMRDLLELPYALEDASFLAAIRGETEPDPPLAAGIAVQRIVEAAYESSRMRQPLDLKS